MGDLDAAATQSTHIMTTIVGNGSSLKPGTYTLTVSVTPSFAYESGDGASSPLAYGYCGDPIIFSGTRISIIYPKFLQMYGQQDMQVTQQTQQLMLVTI